MTAMERYAPLAHPAPVAERLSTDQLRYIANTDLIPKAYRANLPAIMACVLTGRALGLDDMHALRSIHVVDGRATLGAELMVSLVRRAGHSISGEMGAESATAKGRRSDTGDEMSVTWTIEDAKRAGLAGKQNWAKYPGSMLWARAVSQLVRMLFPDALLGLAYTPEEMGDDGSVVVDAVPVETGSVLEDGRPALDGPGETFDGTGAFQGSAGEPSGQAFGPADTGAEAARTAEPVSSPADMTAPSEEAPSGADGAQAERESAAPTPEAAPSAASGPQDDIVIPKLISAAQLKRLMAIAGERGVSEPRQKLIVEAVAGVSSRNLIPKASYDAVVAAFEAETQGGPAEISPFVPPAGALAHRDPVDQ